MTNEQMKNEKRSASPRSGDIRDRTFRFALAAVKFVARFPTSGPTRVLGEQLLRSATSVGANVEEADAALTKADFLYKMNTAQKEAKEYSVLASSFTGFPSTEVRQDESPAH